MNIKLTTKSMPHPVTHATAQGGTVSENDVVSATEDGEEASKRLGLKHLQNMASTRSRVFSTACPVVVPLDILNVVCAV